MESVEERNNRRAKRLVHRVYEGLEEWDEMENALILLSLARDARAGSTCLSNYGAVLCDLGRYREAMTFFTRALDLEPDHKEATHNLGVAQANTGELEKGALLMRKSSALAPSNHAILAYFDSQAH